MNSRLEQDFPMEHELTSDLRRVAGMMDLAGSAAAVNRTHRVVRERAKSMQEQRGRVRSLWIPLTVCFGFMASILFAVWSLLDESEFIAEGTPDSTQQMMMLGIWCLPLSVAVLVVVWFRLRGGRQ